MLISELLVGQYYRSRSYERKGLDGIIKRAELRDDVKVANGEIAYAVLVEHTPANSNLPTKDYWATYYVMGDK